ncbi:MAG: hypothetical protein WCE32_11245, partial [Pseudolabrys sp.]
DDVLPPVIWKIDELGSAAFGNLGEVVLKRPVNVVAGEQLRDASRIVPTFTFELRKSVVRL